MIQRMLAIWSLVPLPFLKPAWTSGSSLSTYYWSLAWRILSISLLVCEMSANVWYFEHFWHFLSLGLEWKLIFSSPVATAEFSKFAGIFSATLRTKLVGVMEFQLSCFKSWKMMLWKCCTQYASKFGKLSSGHRTGKGQFSFQSQRKAMPKNAQTPAKLHSSHMLVK